MSWPAAAAAEFERMRRQALSLLCVVFLMWTAAACTVYRGVVPSMEIDQANRKWQELGITSYHIEVLAVRSIWHAQLHQITVRRSQVTEASASCIPTLFESGNCTVEAFQAEAYTVPGLLARARSQVQSEQARWAKISYHPIYGFPNQISFDDPEILDEDWTWRVTAFEVLK